MPSLASAFFFATDLTIFIPGSHVVPFMLVLTPMNLYFKEFYITGNAFYA